MDPSIELDKGSSVPLHRQISDSLRKQIHTGVLRPGDRVPPSRDLALELRVNRVTVQNAYRGLQAEGLIESHVGQGTFVAQLPAAASPATPEGVEEESLVERHPDHRQALSRGMFSPRVEQLFRIGEKAPDLHSDHPEVIDFSGRIPDERLFDVDGLRAAIDRALRKRGAELLQYGPPLGDADLRAWIASHLCRRGVRAEPEEVLLLSGAQQGIPLLATAFCESGDQVITARPTYHLVLDIFGALGLEIRTVPMTPEGIDVSSLAREIRAGVPRLIYTMPDFQNPTGITQSDRVRRELVHLSARSGVPIIEDDFEHELRFRGADHAPLAAQPESELVIHLGTFSKGLFPGLRVGWIHARRPILSRLLKLKSTFDLGGGSLIQAALYEFIASGDYDRHLRILRRHLEVKHDLMSRALEKHLDGCARWTRPDGGYAVWVEFEPRVDLARLLQHAQREGILFTPGDLFVKDAPPPSALRLTLSRVDPEQIEPGIAALTRALEQCEGDLGAPSAAEDSIPLI